MIEVSWPNWATFSQASKTAWASRGVEGVHDGGGTAHVVCLGTGERSPVVAGHRPTLQQRRHLALLGRERHRPQHGQHLRNELRPVQVHRRGVLHRVDDIGSGGLAARDGWPEPVGQRVPFKKYGPTIRPPK